MSRIAFIGLGVMGLPMAINLVRAGHDVVGVNRSPHRLRTLAAAGGRSADSIADAVRDAEFVVTMLPDGPDVEAVLTAPEGVLAHAGAGTVWIDSSTIAPETAQRLARRAAEHGIPAIDAPVSGGEQGAIDGTLSIMVGGDPATVEAARPILTAVGRTVVRVGTAGAGQTVKAANQLIVAVTIEAVAEAIAFLERQQVDVDAAVQVLQGGLAASRVLELKASAMTSRSFAPGFRLALHDKDLGIAAAAARAAGVFAPATALVAQLVAAAVSSGAGALDHSALFAQVDRLSRPLGSPPAPPAASAEIAEPD